MKRRKAGLALLIVALSLLAYAEMAVSPSMAELCGQMANFPCGP